VIIYFSRDRDNRWRFSVYEKAIERCANVCAHKFSVCFYVYGTLVSHVWLFLTPPEILSTFPIRSPRMRARLAFSLELRVPRVLNSSHAFSRLPPKIEINFTQCVRVAVEISRRYTSYLEFFPFLFCFCSFPAFSFSLALACSSRPRCKVARLMHTRSIYTYLFSLILKLFKADNSPRWRVILGRASFFSHYRTHTRV